MFAKKKKKQFKTQKIENIRDEFEVNRIVI